MEKIIIWETRGSELKYLGNLKMYPPKNFKFVDFRNGETIRSAIHMAIGAEGFQNIYAVDKNICGRYIPPKYQSSFETGKTRWSEQQQNMHYYDIKVTTGIDKA